MPGATYRATEKAQVDLQHDVIVLEASHALDPRHPVEVLVPIQQWEVIYLAMRQAKLMSEGARGRIASTPDTNKAATA